MKTKQLTLRVLRILLLLLSAQMASAQIKSFTGTWKLNLEMTNVPGVSPNSIPKILKVKQDSRSITINKISKEDQDEKSGYVETLKYDGTNTETNTPSGLKRTSSIKWSTDQKAFTETFTSKDEQGTVKQTSTQTWSLSADGKSLVLTVDLQVGERNFHMEEIYEKQ
jgi:hypothetical protein